MGLLDNIPRTSTPATVENMMDLLATLFLGSAGLFTRLSAEDGVTAYYPSLGYSNANITTVPAASTLLALPFWSGAGGVVSEIGFSVAVVGAAGSFSRVGIYDSEPGIPKPRTLIVDGGQIDTNASTGSKLTTGLAVKLDAHKLYHLVFQTNAFPPTVSGVASSIPIYGMTLPLSDYRGWSVAQAFGALPPTWPAGSVLFGGGNSSPIVIVRFSSYNRI